jgi:hypothetical protein
MSREQGPQPQDGDATGRDCRLTPIAGRSESQPRFGGGGMSREQGPQPQDGDATGRDCRLTPTAPMLKLASWSGGGAA